MQKAQVGTLRDTKSWTKWLCANCCAKQDGHEWCFGKDTGQKGLQAAPGVRAALSVLPTTLGCQQARTELL